MVFQIFVSLDFKLTEAQVIAQSVLFLIAGFETSSTLLTFMCYELAINQEIQEKLRGEIFTVLKKYDGKCTHEAMQEMSLLDMVLSGVCYRNTYIYIYSMRTNCILIECFRKSENASARSTARTSVH